MHRILRRLAGTVLALVAVVPVGACAGDPAVPDVGGEQGWTFTDDMGDTVTLDEPPTRVAGLNDVLSSLWNYGIEPVASFGYTALEDDVAFDGQDLDAVQQVGTGYGQIDLEQLAAADPDVIVTSVYPVDSAGTLDPASPLYGFESVEQQEQVAQIAPIIAIAWRGSAADVIERTAELAEALGADLNGAEAAAMRRDYEQASEALRAAATGGLTVLPVAAYPDEGFYMAKAPDDPSLRLYSELGVRFVDPGGSDYFWQVAGWENVPDYRSDVILYSLRAMDPDQMRAHPTFQLLPAAQAGQVYPWKYIGMDYLAQARYMNELAGWLRDAVKVT